MLSMECGPTSRLGTSGPFLCTVNEEPPAHFSRSIFLLGADGTAWGTAAVQALKTVGFDDGVIFVGGSESVGGCETEMSSDWAVEARLMSDVIICFVPPEMSEAEASRFILPVLQWTSSGKLICTGQGKVPQRLLSEVKVRTSLEDACSTAWKMVVQGADRSGAERRIPLMIWQTASWSGWYNNLVLAGNRLDGAKIEWSFRVGPNQAFVLFWAVHVDIFVAAEQRNKSNEVVVSRPDIACVLAYLPGKSMLDTEIVLIKEFRSPCCNAEMFVCELPGGSSFKPNSDFFQTAADELSEETGIKVAKDRLSRELSRQAVATVSTHLVHLFSCKLTKEEMEMARHSAKDGTAFGNASETEITYIVTMSLAEALESNALDFLTLGMVMQTIGILYGQDECDEKVAPDALIKYGRTSSFTVAALSSHLKSFDLRNAISAFDCEKLPCGELCRTQSLTTFSTLSASCEKLPCGELCRTQSLTELRPTQATIDDIGGSSTCGRWAPHFELKRVDTIITP